MRQPVDVTIATHQGEPAGVPEDHLLATAIAQEGGEVRYAVWTDDAVDWSVSAVTIIRSTWDYHLNPDAWRSWLSRVQHATRIVNQPELIRWNADKVYLLELIEKGVAVVPTLLLDTADDLAGECERRGWTDVVVKPTIGASSFGTRRFQGPAIPAEGVRHAASLLEHARLLVQPYQRTLETDRERSLVFVGGEYCHAFTKPAFHAALDDIGFASHQASDAELAAASEAMAALPAPPLVARVDLIPSAAGPLLMEVELIEPQLGLTPEDRATRLLAERLVTMARRSAP